VLPFINYRLIKVTGLQLSLIQASGAIGVIIAALAISIRKTFYKVLLKKFFTLFRTQAVMVVLWIFPVLPFFAANSKWYITVVFSLILVVYGALNAMQNIPMITYFQLKIPDELRGRIIGVFISSLFITSPLGMWMYGFLLEKVGWTYVILTSGVLLFILGLLAGGNKNYRAFLAQLKSEEEEQGCETSS
jgi:MFS family permease